MTKIETPKPLYYCIDCSNATPDMQFKNLSLTGEPTLVSCKYSKWKQNAHQVACKMYNK